MFNTIHMFLEQRIEVLADAQSENGEWLHWGRGHLQRGVRRFAADLRAGQVMGTRGRGVQQRWFPLGEKHTDTGEQKKGMFDRYVCTTISVLAAINWYSCWRDQTHVCVVIASRS